jgi:SulP family sulfate permease
VDATAAFNLRKVAQAAAARQVELVLTDVPTDLQPRLRSARVTSLAHVHAFSDLDRGLEWCERRLLNASNHDRGEGDVALGVLAGLGVPAARLPALQVAFTRRELQAGDVLVAQGDPADTLYVVESGLLTAQLAQAGGDPLRLETVGPGAVLGELGYFLQRARSATVVADEPSVVYQLDRDALERLKRDDPATALALHETMTRRLSERVHHLMGVVRALES